MQHEFSILDTINLVGVLKTNKNGDVTYINNTAKIYKDHFEYLGKMARKNIISFCLYEKPAEIQILKIDNENIIIINSLKERYKLIEAKKNLRSNLDGLNKVIDNSFDGIVISDNTGVIIHQNPAYEKITGLSAKQLIGRNLKDIENEGIINVSASLKAIEENQDVTVLQKINTGAQVLVSAVPIRNRQGEVDRVVNSVRDLTKLNLLENGIKELEKENKLVNEELKRLKEQNDPKLSIISYSNKMKEVISRTLRVSQIDSAVLIQGESGVGKEKIVNLIHSESYRAAEPLIKINCGAIPGDLLESELFGYEPGAFTGASSKGKKGLFEAADNGIVFLDEIGEMTLSLQVKLLRFLQDFELTRIGGTKPIRVNTRIIAATNKDLNEMVKQGAFRKDLYYRLSIIPIYVPPLRERKDDIIPLVYHFLRGLNNKYGLKRSFSKHALHKLENYDWPGNVRELENFMERITLMSMNAEICTEDIQAELEFSYPTDDSFDHKGDINETLKVSALKDQVTEYEKNIIKNVIALYPSIRKAAEALKVDQSTLVRKIQKYGIEK